MSTSPEERLLAREAARIEETKRFNAEREIAQALAPRQWSEFKRAFNEKCNAINRLAVRYFFECEEADSSRLFFQTHRQRGSVESGQFSL